MGGAAVRARPAFHSPMLESTSRHLEASSAEDVPPRSWERIVSAAETMAARLFPEGSVSLRLVSDTTIRNLNRDFREIDKPTDVLSFPGGNGGDIAVSWPTTLRQAAENGNTPEDESIALIAHGLLHLAGYDHDSDAAEQRMQAATRELLSHVHLEVATFGH